MYFYILSEFEPAVGKFPKGKYGPLPPKDEMDGWIYRKRKEEIK